MLKTSNTNFSKKVKKIVLDNGLNIIIDQAQNYQSVSIGFFLKKGSRDENINQLGYSHFCEHMIFKGTDKLNKKQIAENFDKMGGYINAYTTHELIVIYNRVPYFYLEENIKLIYEIFNNSIFDKKELDMERDVIINEIHSEFEDPHEKVYEEFMKNIFPDQSLGYPIIGNEESINNVKRDELYQLYQNIFNIDDLLIVLSGKIDEKKILKTLEQLKFRRKKKQIIIEENAIQKTQGNFFINLPSEQVHIISGTSKFNTNNESFIKIGILNLIIGESMSSRFFQKIRDELGLCYSIYTFFNKFRKENLFGFYMSVRPGNINKAFDETSSIIKDLLKHGITKEELIQAKEQKIIEIILNNDVLQKRMQKNAFMDIKFGRIYSINEIISIIENTTLNDLNEIINKIFINNNFITQTLYKKNIKTGELKF